MNKTIKTFLHRGMIFGGFGPIIAGVVYLIHSQVDVGCSFDGINIFTAIISTYFLAFIHAGASVFNQIENWSIAKSTLCHMSTLYIAYTLCYLINAWIPFDLRVLLIYTLCFVALYFVIWFTVFTIIKINERKLNSMLK